MQVLTANPTPALVPNRPTPALVPNRPTPASVLAYSTSTGGRVSSRRRPAGTRRCGCGAPATEKITFSAGDTRWYCHPCS